MSQQKPEERFTILWPCELLVTSPTNQHTHCCLSASCNIARHTISVLTGHQSKKIIILPVLLAFHVCCKQLLGNSELTLRPPPHLWCRSALYFHCYNSCSIKLHPFNVMCFYESCILDFMIKNYFYLLAPVLCHWTVVFYVQIKNKTIIWTPGWTHHPPKCCILLIVHVCCKTYIFNVTIFSSCFHCHSAPSVCTPSVSCGFLNKSDIITKKVAAFQCTSACFVQFN